MSVLTRENYHDYPAISNSLLAYLLPESGGSIFKFNYFRHAPPSKKESAAMRFGTLVHQFLENPEMFSFEVVEKPSDNILIIIDTVFSKVSSTPTIGKLGDYSKDLLEGARAIGYGKAWKDDTVVKKVIEAGDAYFTARVNHRDAVLVDQETADRLTGVINSIRTYTSLLADDLADPDVEVFRELPILFTKNGEEVKVLIDRLEINHKNQTYQLYDYKTTDIPLSFFFGFEKIVYEKTSGEAVTETIPGAMYDRQVHRQLALYNEAIQSKWPGYFMSNFPIIVGIEANEPFEIRSEYIHEKWLLIGVNRVKEAFRILDSVSESL